MWWYAPVVPAQRKQRIIGSRLAGLLCKILFQREKEEKEVGGALCRTACTMHYFCF